MIPRASKLKPSRPVVPENRLLEGWLCALIIAGCVVLHFQNLYNAFGLPIEAALSLVSFATPVSGMLFLSAAQVLPDAPGSPVSVSEMALVGFFLGQLLRGKVMDVFTAGRPLWLAALPFYLWYSGLNFLRQDYRAWLLVLFAILTGCVAAALVRQSGNRLPACLVAFAAGQGLALCLFWIVKLHLGAPTQAFDVEIYGDSTADGMRIGTARGNANMLGPAVALAGIGAVGWFISRSNQGAKAFLIVSACLAALIPPLIGSGCRGAMSALLLGVVFLMVFSLLAGRALASLPLVLAVAGSALIIIFGWHKLGLDASWQEMHDRQETEAANTGAGLTAGRTLEWTAAWNAIIASPIMGGGEIKTLSYQGHEDLWASHSTYLDAGLAGGFPGMGMFIWFILKPIFELWRRIKNLEVVYLLAVYLVAIVAIASTSAMQLKHFWMLWGMAGTCFLPAVAAVKARVRPGLRTPPKPA